MMSQWPPDSQISTFRITEPFFFRSYETPTKKSEAAKIPGPLPRLNKHQLLIPRDKSSLVAVPKVKNHLTSVLISFSGDLRAVRIRGKSCRILYSIYIYTYIHIHIYIYDVYVDNIYIYIIIYIIYIYNYIYIHI